MYIVDTNVLMSLNSFEGLLNTCKNIYIPVEVLSELDKHKTAEGIKGYKARRAIRNINKNIDKFTFLNKDQDFYHVYNRNTTYIDDIIISYFDQYNMTLITNDIGMKIKAEALGIPTINYYENTVMPISCLKVKFSNKQLENFSDEMLNKYEVPVGQYIIVEDESGATRHIRKYFGEGLWESPTFDGIGNYLFSIKPLDAYQSCAIDSLFRDNMTVITGPAGSGKTLMSLAYCLQKISTGSRVHVFVNPVKTKNSEELGFYPGDRDEKLLQNFIGGILKNKIGDITEVERLLDEGLLNLYPFSDIRGIEVGKGDIMYITEAQNLSVELIKLGIQRCAEGSKIIIEGDPETQVDKDAFMNESNGLKRVIQVYTGDEQFSHVYLPNIYRSKLAERAERL